MICPRCQIELERIEIEGLELDYCSECQGVWFDKGEVAAFFGFPQDAPEDDGIGKGLGRLSALACPRCPEGKLHEMQYSSATTLMVDKCDLCSGFWFDGGEIPELKKENAVKIIKALMHPIDQVRFIIYHARKALR